MQQGPHAGGAISHGEEAMPMDVYFWAAVATIVATLIGLIDHAEKWGKRLVRKRGKKGGRRR